MDTLATITDMIEFRHKLNGCVGFVPTMGYLHEGHLSLINRAKIDCDHVIVSVFVNPTQFAPNEDFAAYPRNIEKDGLLCETANIAAFFTPSASEMYPKDFNTFVEVNGITERLEGASRPTHFRGVTTVVSRLFNIVRPHIAYFGQKDAQQTLVIAKMVKDLNMDIEIAAMPIIREVDGLAMSSRNFNLDDEDRNAALSLYHALKLADGTWRNGETSTDRIKNKMAALINCHPQARVDYISIADVATLEELVEISPPALVSLAVNIGKTRLIDNITLK